MCASALAQSPLEQAVKLAREKRFAEAAKLLEGIQEPAPLPQRIAFHRLRAAIDSGLGENVAAANEMRAALELSPADSNLLLATAVAESQAGFLDDAVNHARQVHNAPTAESVLGDIEERRGDYSKAVEAYQSAVALDPAKEEYRSKLAFVWIEHQNFRPAIDLLEQSSPLFPHSAKIRTLLGIANYAEGEIQEAENALADAITVDSTLQAAYECLAEIVLQSSAAPSERIVQSLCKWNDLVCSALDLRVARENGDTKLARQAIARLKIAPPNNALGRCELARGLEWAGQLEEARGEMETCVKLDPLPQNHYRLALLYSKLGLKDLAREQLQLRSEILQKMSEQTALGLSALQALGHHPN